MRRAEAKNGCFGNLWATLLLRFRFARVTGAQRRFETFALSPEHRGNISPALDFTIVKASVELLRKLVKPSAQTCMPYWTH